MMPVSGINTGAVQPSTARETVPGASRVQQSGDEAQSRPPKPVMDEYLPEEPQEPSGRYWLGRDEDGQPKIYFDSPERTPEAPKQPESAPEADALCTSNTDAVDRTIEQLKRKQEELSQRLNTETDEARRKDLERQLAQVEQELKQKDNETYRRQHTQFS